jgi:pimeloyl-ACP methyl ester carboxylesterase
MPVTPPLLPGRLVHLPDRGEVLVRHHQHEDASAPTLLLLHGWTANADTQFFTAYEELAQHFSVITVDHRGHGRGLRPDQKFALEDCADDAADVVRQLGADKVITVGYSMGGPVSFMFWKRHPQLVSGMVFQATAMEWRATRGERARWQVGHVLGPVIRKLTTPRSIRFGLRRAIPRGHELSQYVPWIIGEIRRNDPWMVSEAGRALSKFDARPFAADINVPTAMVLTTKDRLVLPVKQRQLADAVRAHVVELHGEHLVPMQQPREFSAATRQAAEWVAAQVAVR